MMLNFSIFVAVVATLLLILEGFYWKTGHLIFLYLARHPKCPFCGQRVNFVIPIMLKRCKSTYTCNNCRRVVPSIKFRSRQGGVGK